MQEAVSAVLLERTQQADGLSRMLVASVGAHVLLVAVVLLAPADWWGPRPVADSAMTISLGGVEGPDVGGMTSIADRAVQSVAKPDAPKAIERPPAAKPPEMVESIAKPLPKPVPPVKRPDETSKARTPTAGAEIKSGSARVTTGGAAVPFGGLASQSGGGGDGVKLDVGNFCCPQYIVQMRQMIQRNWNPNIGAAGQPVVKFTIRRDGMLTQVELTQSSGQALLDIEARRAVLNTKQLPPLPREFDGPHLTVHLTFDFKR
jgi:TonB family protein